MSNDERLMTNDDLRNPINFMIFKCFCDFLIYIGLAIFNLHSTFVLPNVRLSKRVIGDTAYDDK